MSLETFNILTWNLLWQGYREQSYHCREQLKCREPDYPSTHQHSQPDPKTTESGFQRRIGAIVEVFRKAGRRSIFCLQEVDRSMLTQLLKSLGKGWTVSGKERPAYFTTAIVWHSDVFSYQEGFDVQLQKDKRIARCVTLALGEHRICVLSAHLQGHSIADRKKGIKVDTALGDRQLSCYLEGAARKLNEVSACIIGMDGNFAPDNQQRMAQIKDAGWLSTDEAETHMTEGVGCVCIDYQLAKIAQGYELSWQPADQALVNWSLLDTRVNYGLNVPSDHKPKLVHYSLQAK